MGARNAVRFFLDGELVELDEVDPTRTVLEYLREDRARVGTKEGCAEGDCGACTVVLAELDASGGDVRVRAVNACIQFLATLDGKALLTVESLSRAGDPLHPVQQAMVNEHGSQCGFCTPGFVMSLFALFKTEADPGRVAIDDALAGNLCRCTGYRPIIAAAESMYELAGGGDWLTTPAGQDSDAADIVANLKSLEDTDDLVVGMSGRRFIAPASVDSLAAVLDENPGATILAGGTDVGLWVTKHYRELDPVVYVGRVAGFDAIEVTDTAIEIGAGATLTDAVPALLQHFPDLEELFLRWASPPIRNAATLGGNVANGSPIGDSMPALLAAGAEVELRSVGGSRTVTLEDFYIDYQVKDLKPGEFVERIRVPLPAPGSQLKSYKISKRFDQDITAVCLGASIRLDEGVARDVRLAYGGMAATIRRARGAEAALEGKPLDDSSIAAAMNAVESDFTPLTDMRASAEYRRIVSRNLLKRLQLDLAGEAQSVYAYGRAS